MKKVILATMALTFTAISNANASVTVNPNYGVEDTLKVQTNHSDTLRTATDTEKDKTPVKIEELPGGVKTALAGERFTGWKAERAFWVTGEATKTTTKTTTEKETSTSTTETTSGYYEVELSRNTDTKIVRFNKEGGELK